MGEGGGGVCKLVFFSASRSTWDLGITLPCGVGSGVNCRAQRGELERLGLGSKLSQLRASHQESLAHRVGVQGPGPASWPGLFLALSSLAEAAVCE